MTSSADTEGHPEAAEISALLDGALTAARATEVRGHVARCAACADVHASLEEIRTLLGTLPDPGPMPADVTRRIEAALAAEALGGPALAADATAGASAATAGGDVSRETQGSIVARAVSRETRATVSRETPQGADGTLGGGTREEAVRPGGSPVAADRPAGRPHPVGGSGSRPGGGPGPHGRHPRRRRGLLGAASVAALFCAGAFLIAQSFTDDETTGARGSSRSPSAPVGLSAAGLKARVQAMLVGEKADAPHVEPESSSRMPMRADNQQVPSCVQAGTGRTEQPLASQQDSYNGSDAYILVLPHPGDRSLVDVFVIDASCTTASASPVGAQLLVQTYRRD
ncbi:zf-HC2 domain-containing protein [Streptomyces sp. B1866]|uniref:anti-sigma factor family protein n=1 Tax=Streptomyces sp. B1866 TaxID=3075431 RepID=UPI00288E3F41|nr:zf-HC2 domain-containing protein [Streptomyces sp. B1866]MDT3395269.1 zf-HC2 domain-containing protein [Streptomyces sp. B1866]